MPSLATQLDTAAVGSKIVRTADGAYFQAVGAAPVLLDATEDVYSLPIGSVLTVVGVGPVAITAVIPGKGAIPSQHATPQSAPETTVTGATLVATITAGLATFNGTYRTT